MKRTLIATTAALATLAGTTSAFAEVTCQDLYDAAEARDLLPEDGAYTLTDPDGRTVCGFDENGVLVQTYYEDATGLSEAIQNASPQAAFGLATALDAQDGGVDGETQSRLARQQGAERSEQGSQRAEQGSQRAGNAGGRENAGGRP